MKKSSPGLSAALQQSLQQAVAHHTAGKLQEAEAIYRQILQTNPNEPSTLHLLGFLHHQCGDNDSAVTLMQKAIALHPPFFDAHNNLGIVYAAMGNWPDAAASYRRAIKYKPDYAAAHYNLGNALHSDGKLDEASASFRLAIRHKADSPEAECNLGNVLKQQGKLDQAVQCYQRAIALRPNQPDAHNNLGNALKDQGLTDMAMASFQRALQIDPNHYDAHNNLGNALKGQGKFSEAVLCFQRALQIKPDLAELHNNLGNVLRSQGKLDAAIASFTHALQLKPDFIDACSNLGDALTEAGELEQAVDFCRRAIELDADFYKAHNNLGNALQEQGEYEEAHACYARALAIKPDYHIAHSNLGKLLKDDGEFDEAIACYRRALEIDPAYHLAHNGLGTALQARGDMNDAIACYQAALAHNPTGIEARKNLGNALLLQERFAEAADCYRRVIALDPEYIPSVQFHLGVALQAQGDLVGAINSYREAASHEYLQIDALTNLADCLNQSGDPRAAMHYCDTILSIDPAHSKALQNLGNAYKMQSMLDEAANCYERMLEIDDDDHDALNNLGNVRQEQGRLDEALACFRHAMQVQPDSVAAHTNLLLAYNYYPALNASEVFDEYRRWNAQHAEKFSENLPSFTNVRNPEKRLKIGYVSADFRDHPVAHFTSSLIERHDPRQFEVFCYYNHTQCDAYTARIEAAAEHWTPCVGMSDEQLAQRIRDDGIDILVDLSGHTGGNRLLVFARKPAPVQVTYLGYVATTGLRTMDYRLTHEDADPSGNEVYYSEILYRLPTTLYCYRPQKTATTMATPAHHQAPVMRKGTITFGSLNNFAKISSETIAVWSEILRALPDARLLMASVANGSTRLDLLDRFAAQGIAAHRIQLHGRLPPAEFQQLHQEIDIALDSFPFNGGTTTCQILSLGVPVVTLIGEQFVARVGYMLLKTLGLTDLAAANKQEYVEIAVTLACNRLRLQELHTNLRERFMSSPSSDEIKFVGGVEIAWRAMWRNWCAKN